MTITTQEEINACIRDGCIDTVIQVTEARQVKRLSQIADTICARANTRLVLVAGASSAGKTTTAKRICTQLMVNDRDVQMLSTDDYFVGEKLNPRDENGEPDYEHVKCVDLPRLALDINALFRGEPIPHRKFDFINHAPTLCGDFLKLPPNGIVVLEGIHALNPLLTEGIADELKFRLFVEPQPEIDVFGGFTPTSADARFLRRLVRDNQFRRLSPLDTLHIWPKVRAGEAKWIEPFRHLANAEFNSYLAYELSALRYFVAGLLEKARRELGDDRFILNMIELVNLASPLDPNNIPGNSILRETIGGSQLGY